MEHRVDITGKPFETDAYALGICKRQSKSIEDLEFRAAYRGISNSDRKIEEPLNNLEVDLDVFWRKYSKKHISIICEWAGIHAVCIIGSYNRSSGKLRWMFAPLLRKIHQFRGSVRHFGSGWKLPQKLRKLPERR